MREAEFVSQSQKALEILPKRTRLGTSNRNLLESKLGKSYLEELYRRSSADYPVMKSLVQGSLGMFCLHCKFRLCDHRGSSTSVCGVCQSMGVSPSEYRTERTRLTCMELYGVSNGGGSEASLAKIKETCLKKFGVDNPFKSPEVKSRLREKLIETGQRRSKKRKKTMERRYGDGITHWSQVPELQKKFQKAMEATHGKGVTNVMHVVSHRESHKSRMSELASEGFWKRVYDQKVVPAILKKFGVKNIFEDSNYIQKKRLESTGHSFPMQDPEVRKKRQATCVERYGGTHHMHDPEIFARTMASKRTMHLYGVEFDKHLYRVLGTYEIFVLSYLLTKYPASRIRSGFDLANLRLSISRRYYPDFHLVDSDRYLEVKSSYTLLGCKKHEWSLWKSNKKKARECFEEGWNVVWIVAYPSSSKIVTLPRDWFRLSRSVLSKLLEERHSVVEPVPTIPEAKLQVHRLGEFGKTV